jgi:methionyl-tRNA formyltransferase
LRRLKRTGPVEVRNELDAAYAKPDLIVSWFWMRRLPKHILDLAPAIGVHPSLLPRWRGPDPYFWAIYSGDAVTGVTAHLLDEEYDTGALLAQKTLAIDRSWNAWTLARKLDRPSLSLLREVVRAYAEGRPPTPMPQDEAHVTQAPSPDDDRLEIRWTEPAATIERLVRAAAPYPGAFSEIGGKTVVLTRARITDPPPLEPGEAWVSESRAVVRAKDAGIELLEGRLDETDAALDGLALARLIKA